MQSIYQQSGRKGFTVVEVLVSTGIVALLIAITLPAVQSSRATARRAMCLNHLHQIGTAAHNHVEAHRTFPAHSPLLELLPDVGESALFHKLNPPSGPFTEEESRQLRTPPVYRCPSDPLLEGVRAFSYHLNEGTLSPFGDSENGFLRTYTSQMRFEEVTDGLSQTVMFSECLGLKVAMLGDQQRLTQSFVADAQSAPMRYLWYLDRRYSDTRSLSEACHDSSRRTTVEYPLIVPIGGSDVSGGMESGYSHLIKPNQPGCSNGPPPVRPNIPAFGLLSSSGLHEGGVNMLLGDGSARFVSNGVDMKVWMAIGTINGNETLTEF